MMKVTRWNSHVSSRTLCLLYKFVSACPLLQKGMGHLAALYYTCYLLLVMNYLAIKTICYCYFQYLQRIPCWKPLVISFCSSLGSTFLLIGRTTIDPLYLWAINYWRKNQQKRGHLLLTRQQGVSPMGAPWCLVGPQAAVWPNSNAINSLSPRKK